MEPDAELAADLARDLDGSFPALVDGHVDRLYSIALRLLGDPRDAEEVAQDALVRAYRAIGSYPAERTSALRLRPWLASIAVNLARNRRRRLDDRQPPGSFEQLAEAGFDPPSGRDAPGRTAERHETQQELAAALLRLRPAVRAAIVLRHVDGLSLAETADALGRPEGTIKAQVHRGLLELRADLASKAAATDHANRTTLASLMPALEAVR